MRYLPAEIQTTLKQRFYFPEQPLFGTVATLKANAPQVRTMRVYDVDSHGSPILLTHTGSNKWEEWMRASSVAICMVSGDKLTQIVVRGEVILTTPAEVREQAQFYWDKVRSDVKKIYDPAYAVGELYRSVPLLKILERPSPTFGMVRILPSFWELLELDQEYVESKRYQFHVQGAAWECKRLNVG